MIHVIEVMAALFLYDAICECVSYCRNFFYVATADLDGDR